MNINEANKHTHKKCTTRIMFKLIQMIMILYLLLNYYYFCRLLYYYFDDVVLVDVCFICFQFYKQNLQGKVMFGGLLFVANVLLLFFFLQICYILLFKSTWWCSKNAQIIHLCYSLFCVTSALSTKSHEKWTQVDVYCLSVL